MYSQIIGYTNTYYIVLATSGDQYNKLHNW